jgi:peroxisomal coenzyme A diphosphatase NUDT7
MLCKEDEMAKQKEQNMQEWDYEFQKKRLEEIAGSGHVARSPRDQRMSAVLIPLIEGERGYEILFEQRSLKLAVQPGDICLPGGGIEEGESPQEAAVRETMEELLIKKEQIKIISPLDGTFGPGDRIIWPFLGIISDYKGSWSKDEVDHTFTIPLSYFLETEPERYEAEQITVPEEGFPYELVTGGRSYRFRKRKYTFLFYRTEKAVIWGATARVIRGFTEFWKWKLEE